MESHTSVKVLNGSKTSFWYDNWLGASCLNMHIPDIYGLVQHQQKTVAETWTLQCWDLIFRKMRNDWEVTRLTEFYKQLKE